MPRSAHLIFNPVAGQGNTADQDLRVIESILSSAIDLKIHLTSPECGAEELTQRAIAEGAEVILVSGGDGTLSAAATALVNRDIPLGVIARGTANAFAKALGIPDTLEAACQTILKGKTRQVDTAVCNGRPVVLMAGVGPEAEMVAQADRQLKNRFGQLAYVLAALNQFRKFNRFRAAIETEDEVVTTTAYAVTVANAAPPTSIWAQGPAGLVADDGLLDVTIVASRTRREAIAASWNLFYSALRGRPAQQNSVSYLRAKQVKIITHPPQKIAFDGEISGETPLEIACVPNGLTIFVPPDDD